MKIWQICIPPILVEVLAPHFAVRYSCRSVLVFLGSFVLFFLPFWLRCWTSRFGVTILLSFDFLGIFVLFGCIVLTSRFVVLPNCTPPVRLR